MEAGLFFVYIFSTYSLDNSFTREYTKQAVRGNTSDGPAETTAAKAGFERTFKNRLTSSSEFGKINKSSLRRWQMTFEN